MERERKGGKWRKERKGRRKEDVKGKKGVSPSSLVTTLGYVNRVGEQKVRNCFSDFRPELDEVPFGNQFPPGVT